MPERKTIQQARRAKAEGKRPTTQAGAFVAEEMRHVKRGKHGVASRKQAVAIGLSKARRSGVRLPAPGRGRASPKTRRSAESASRRGQRSGELRGEGRGRTSSARGASKRQRKTRSRPTTSRRTTRTSSRKRR